VSSVAVPAAGPPSASGRDATAATAATAAGVLAELRRARRKQRVAEIHWIDALYQVYITALLSLVAVLVLSGLTGDGKVGADVVRQAVNRGPAVLGLAAAVMLLIGLRSGCRGGPLALEKADVRHVLLSPIDRGAALRPAALRQLRFSLFAAFVVGAVAGQLAVRRLGGSGAVWVLCGVVFAVAAVGLAVGAALVASGRRVHPLLGSTIGFVLVAWSLTDLLGRAPTAPLTFLGRAALWPLRFDALALVPMAVVVGLVVAGVSAVSGVSLEAAERRTALVGQMKFAVTLQDLRTVLVLRRQLAMELPRSKPWIGGQTGTRPARGRRARVSRVPVWRRGWRGVLRWPAARVARLVVLAVGAGLALRGAWDGTTPLFLVGGLALWIAALDVIEPLAQETDHPGRLDAYPMERGQLMVRHLAVPMAAMLPVTLVAAAAAVLAGPSTRALQVAALAVVPATLAAVCGAVISVLMGAPKPFDTLSMTAPEIAGMRTLLRTTWPPLVAVLGTVPLLAARAAMQHPPLRFATVEAAAGLGVLTLTLLTLGWVRFRDDIHAWWAQLAADAKATQDAKAAARRERTQPEELDP